MTMKDRITLSLEAAFMPERMVVINESHLHAGHQPGFTQEGETHFRVRLVSERFSGLSRVARQRAVMDVLKSELDGDLHALALEVAAPGEPTRW
jgi:BolA family transcriptional regulator, general stress-responsive regulator